MLSGLRKIHIFLAAAVGAWASPGDSALVELRLQTPLTSYNTPAGTAFQSVVIAPVQKDGRILLPAGTTVYGRVRSRRAVGVGLVHERAALELEFQEYELPDGRRQLLTARLRSVDNARETVNERGRIEGILAANNPQSLAGGMWFRPHLDLIPRSFVGLTGISNRIWEGYELGPIGAVALFAVHCALIRLPEPEIQLPAGTELKAVLSSVEADAPTFPVAAPAQLPDEMREWFAARPFEVERWNGRAAEDVINIGAIGTKEQLLKAFHAAGWFEAAARSARSFSRVYQAYTAQVGYADAPASRMTYQDREPDFVLQKSFNTIAKRHHVRFWRSDWDGREVWLGASTHDVGIRFEASAVSFTHRINPRIDVERTKVLNDLAFTGCADTEGFAERPEAARATAREGQGAATDGRIAVVQLRDCPEVTEMERVGGSSKPSRTILVRTARRMVLEGRQYILRENPIYFAYRFLRWSRSGPPDMSAE